MEQQRRRLTSGDLQHLVTVQAPVGVLSETDAVTVDTDVPMQIEAFPPQFQQRERQAVGGLQTQTYYSVTSRYRTDLRAFYVLLEQCCTQRALQVLAIIPSSRRDSVELTCVTNG